MICRDPQGWHADVSADTVVVGTTLASWRSVTQHGLPASAVRATTYAVLNWKSFKLNRVPRSSLNAETQDAATTADAMEFSKTFWEVCFKTPPLVRCREARDTLWPCDRREVAIQYGEDGVGHSQCCVQTHSSRVASSSTDPPARPVLRWYLQNDSCLRNNRRTVWCMTLCSPQPSGRTPRLDARVKRKASVSSCLWQRVNPSVQAL